MRYLSFILVALAGCPGGQHYDGLDASTDATNIDAAADAGPDATMFPDANPAGPIVTNGQAAEIELGQPNFTTSSANTGGMGAASMQAPTGVASDGTNLWIMDSGNQRALRWSPLPSTSPSDANMVLGRPSLTDNSAISGVNLGHFGGGGEGPHLAVLGSKLIISDTFFNRVLIWDPLPTTPGQPANHVLGQTTANNYSDGNAAGQMYRPRGIWTDGTRLAIADAANNRVLIWTSFPTSDGQAANLVLGQPDFGTSIAPPTTPTATSMAPFGVYFDGTRFYVSDYSGERIMVWNGFPTTKNQPADYAIGQPNLTTGSAGTTQGKVRGPGGMAVLGDALFVTDEINDRVMVWQPIPTTSGVDAAYVLGTDSFVKPGGTPAPTQQSLNDPLDLAIVGHKLYVVDSYNNRVIQYGLNVK